MGIILDGIEKEVIKLNDSIKLELDIQDINNTGEASRSLEVKKYDNRVQSLGVFYLEFLDTGRGPGKYPPTNKIRLWVQQKLGLTDEKEINTATFLISRKIKELGTQIFEKKKKGIGLTEKTERLRKEISSKLPDLAKAEVIQRLDKYKKLFNGKN